MLQVKGLTHRFGGLVAVSKVDLAIEEGQIIGLIDPKEAGKTTCFNLITGLLVLTSGTSTFRGRPLSGLHSHQITALGVARTLPASRPTSKASHVAPWQLPRQDFHLLATRASLGTSRPDPHRSGFVNAGWCRYSQPR